MSAVEKIYTCKGLSVRIIYTAHRSPEVPSAGVQHVAGQGQVGYGVGEDTLGEAAGFVEDDVIDGPGDHSCHHEVMFQSEKDSGDEE